MPKADFCMCQQFHWLSPKPVSFRCCRCRVLQPDTLIHRCTRLTGINVGSLGFLQWLKGLALDSWPLLSKSDHSSKAVVMLSYVQKFHCLGILLRKVNSAAV
ncbi:Hypothetical predicted protein [Podarcis lilfordi]|uniref:Uncharacterized protein n=1 Tax=Podarcis lilfordi TaxID=74358 RepID=A0AA35KDJ4_9SAUR|nr:Hypothetical predicted protein [Podarcis lilfordi]